MKEDDVPRGVLAKDFFGDAALGQVSLDLSRRKLFQLGYVVLEARSIRIGGVDMGTRYLVSKSVDRFG